MAALKFKEQGNKYFQKGPRYYPDALGCYSLAISLKALPDLETSILYSNRSQVYLLLGNNRRAFKDAEEAIKRCPTNVKSFYRAVKSSLSLGLLDEAKSYCDRGLQVSPDHENLIDLAQQIDARILENARRKTEDAPKIVPRDWSKLPIDVLMLIGRRLNLADDYAKFGLVCKPWREAFLKNDKKPSSFLPWVMLMEKEESPDSHRFYCPFTKRLFQINLPEVRGRKCYGSAHGWLVTLDDKHQMHLVDPLSHVRILLPPLDKCPELKDMFINGLFFRDGYVDKVIVLSDPLSSDSSSTILAVYQNTNMAFTKPGDEAWHTLHCGTGDNSVVYDATFFNGNFYVARSSGQFVICNSDGTKVKTLTFKSLSKAWKKKEAFVSYVVDIGGKLHVVVRRMVESTWPYRKTGSFDVYVLETAAENNKDSVKWEEVKTLGGWSVFVGNNYSFAVSELDYPECEGNCIYFTDHNYDFSGQYYHPQFTVPSSCDVGVYSLESKSLTRFLDMGFSRSCLYSLPVWIKPEFYI